MTGRNQEAGAGRELPARRLIEHEADRPAFGALGTRDRAAVILAERHGGGGLDVQLSRQDRKCSQRRQRGQERPNFPPHPPASPPRSKVTGTGLSGPRQPCSAGYLKSRITERQILSSVQAM
jgi:hypothetical protein